MYMWPPELLTSLAASRQVTVVDWPGIGASQVGALLNPCCRLLSPLLGASRVRLIIIFRHEPHCGWQMLLVRTSAWSV